jgi:hypothetical protein
MKTIFVRIREMLSRTQWQRAIAACCVGILLLTTQIVDASLKSSQNQLDRVTAQGESGRPRTTGQWQAEKESLEGKPVKVLERMGKEATDAAGDLAETYSQTVKDLVPGVETNGLPQDD